MPQRFEPGFEHCREQVEALMLAGESLDSVEQFLGEYKLPREQRDAAWLFAWSLERRVRRVGGEPRERTEHLSLVPR